MTFKDYFKIKDVMVRDIYYCDVDDTVETVISTMVENNIGSVLIKKNNKLEGIITERVLIENVLYKNKIPSESFAGQIMVDSIIEVDPNESCLNSMLLMIENSVNGLTVVEDNKVIGVISFSDIFKIMPATIKLLFEKAKMEKLRYGSVFSSNEKCQICGAYGDEGIEKKYICDECLNKIERINEVLDL